MRRPRQIRSKEQWRGLMLTARGAVDPQSHEAESQRLAGHVVAYVRGLGASMPLICAYVPIGTEPGSLAMLDAARGAGARVLVPVTGEPGPLRWSEFTGADDLRRGRFGLVEPAGAPVEDTLVRRCVRAVLLPALAVDERGVRLGRGAGYYDRTLHDFGDIPLIAVVRDCELVTELPEEDHDVRVGWALTPSGGLHRLGGVS